jgi:hypothetical protein
MEMEHAPPVQDGQGVANLLDLEVPLEPYPHPELRAIDGDGNEFPPP